MEDAEKPIAERQDGLAYSGRCPAAAHSSVLIPSCPHPADSAALRIVPAERGADRRAFMVGESGMDTSAHPRQGGIAKAEIPSKPGPAERAERVAAVAADGSYLLFTGLYGRNDPNARRYADESIGWRGVAALFPTEPNMRADRVMCAAAR